MSEIYNRHVFGVANQRYGDLLRWAESCRLIRLASTGCEKRPPLHGRTLVWMGQRLVVWGWRLQKRYGAATTNLTTR
jgi:hypothetical protein